MDISSLMDSSDYWKIGCGLARSFACYVYASIMSLPFCFLSSVFGETNPAAGFGVTTGVLDSCEAACFSILGVFVSATDGRFVGFAVFSTAWIGSAVGMGFATCGTGSNASNLGGLLCWTTGYWMVCGSA